MHPSEMRKILDGRPFEPLRLFISSGQHVDIRHPEMAFVTKSCIVVGVGGKQGVADYAVHCNLLHIVQIEPLNGRRARRPRQTKKPR